jgi:hypothetical protein
MPPQMRSTGAPRADRWVWRGRARRAWRHGGQRLRSWCGRTRCGACRCAGRRRWPCSRLRPPRRSTLHRWGPWRPRGRCHRASSPACPSLSPWAAASRFQVATKVATLHERGQSASAPGRRPTPGQSPKRPPRSLLGNDLGRSWWFFTTLCGSRQIRWKTGLVELGRIELPSARRLTTALRPFPRLSRGGWLTAGSGGLAPSAPSFRNVSGLSHRQRSFPPSTPTSVAGL